MQTPDGLFLAWNGRHTSRADAIHYDSKEKADADAKGIGYGTVLDSPGFTGITTDSLGRLYHWQDGKRVPGPNWQDVTTVPDPAGGEPIPINKYFADHPEQALGTIDRKGEMYSEEAVNVSKTEDYEARLAAAIDRLPAGVLKKQVAPAERFTPEVMPAPGDVKDGGYTIKDGKLYVRSGGALVEQEASAKEIALIGAHLEVRDAVREALNVQLAGENADAARARLNEVYDAFVAEHGLIHDKANRKAFRTDPDSPVLLALENYNAKTGEVKKDDIFRKDVVSHVGEITHADTVAGALVASLQQRGGVDLDHMALLLDRPASEVGRLLVDQGLAFDDPGNGWKPANEYLSGNVRQKLVLARAAALVDPKYAVNVAALEKVQPEDVDYSRIEVKMGATWVPASDMKKFAGYLLEGNAEAFNIAYVPGTGEWLAGFATGRNRNSFLEGSDLATTVWATKRKDFEEILTAALNNTMLTVRDKVPGEDKYIVNQVETDNANAKVQDMKRAFADWVWDDDERRHRLHRFYNDNFNNTRQMVYDGSHQNFPGMNPAIHLREAQKNFVWEVVTTGKGLAAHEVGTGKSFSMIAAAMEQRRLGLARKPCIACLKSNVDAITRDALKLYPGAKILSTTDMFDAKNRKETISKIATGDYDIVIMTHDHLNLLPMKPAVIQGYIESELAELEAARLEAYKANPKKDNRIVKALEHAKDKLETKLKTLLEAKPRDDAVFFEETGIDSLFVDESHKFKSLPIVTKQQQVKGIPTDRSERATNMHMRTSWLQQQHGGRGVMFATGTPVANTMSELYNIQRYLQPAELKAAGLEKFDAWAAAFGDVETKMEFTVAGEYKPVSRFARFVNIPELMGVAKQVMDVQRADDMKNPDGSPAVVRPIRHDIATISPETPAMVAMMADLVRRAQKLKGQRQGMKGADNMLAICTDGRKGAIDLRMLDASAPDDPQSKANKAVAEVLRLHKEKLRDDATDLLGRRRSPAEERVPPVRRPDQKARRRRHPAREDCRFLRPGRREERGRRRGSQIRRNARRPGIDGEARHRKQRPG